MNPRRYEETAVRGAESGVILTQELIDEFITNDTSASMGSSQGADNSRIFQ